MDGKSTSMNHMLIWKFLEHYYYDSVLPKKKKKSYTFSIKQFDDRSFSCNHRVWSTDTDRFVSRKAPGCGGFVPMKSWETSNMAWPPGREQSTFWMGATQFSSHMINSPFIQDSQQISITFNIQITLESPHFAWPKIGMTQEKITWTLDNRHTFSAAVQ